MDCTSTQGDHGRPNLIQAATPQSSQSKSGQDGVGLRDASARRVNAGSTRFVHSLCTGGADDLARLKLIASLPNFGRCD